jgi:alginate O-acetyltransferase complex protein AlgI
MPVFIIGYFLLNKFSVRLGKGFAILGSAIFYAYGGLSSVYAFAISIVVNLILALLITKITEHKKLVMALAVAANVLCLAYFKYCNFFLENVNRLFSSECALRDIVLPIGISFFTFQQIMYVVSVYKGEINEVVVSDYLLYVLWFPKILMGPITAPTVLTEQFHDETRKHPNANNIACGLKIFSYGLFKKMILADTFANAVSWGFSNIDASTSMDWIIIMLSYTFEIYFDFSGYSDMAVGISRMLNIDLPINFDSPYKALSIRDFWKRWHISLTAFLTQYIYIPLGGSKKGKARTYINTMIVFLISGLWHGANWTFVLWGLLHGLFSVIERAFGKYLGKLMEVVRWGITFSIVNVLWLLFRADSITQWKSLMIKILAFQNTTASDGLLAKFVLDESAYIYRIFHLTTLNSVVRGFGMLIFMLIAMGVCLVPENNYRTQNKNNWGTMIIAAICFIWSFLSLSSESVFVYFGF